MDLQIRTLTLDLATQLAPELVAMGADTEWDNWTPDNLLRALPGKFELSQAAFDGQAPAGYLVASRRDGLLHVHHVIVSPSHRSRGIGRKLLQQAARQARIGGLETIRLKVHRSNAGAIRLYEQLQFRISDASEELYTMLVSAQTLSEQ